MTTTITSQLGRYVTRRTVRRLTWTMPWIGGALALVTLGVAVRRKGWLGGTAHTALEFIPFVGNAKNLVELRRGRDLFPDKKPVTFPEKRPVAAS